MHYYSLIACDLFSEFTSSILSFLPRHENQVADYLALMALYGSYSQHFDHSFFPYFSLHIDLWEIIQVLKFFGVEEMSSQLRALKLSYPSLFDALILSMTRYLIHLSNVSFFTKDPSHFLMVL